MFNKSPKKGDVIILVEKRQIKEFCKKCGAILENQDYIYRRRAPNVRTYLCSKCGYFECYVED